jgi:hypothetical protein
MARSITTLTSTFLLLTALIYLTSTATATSVANITNIPCNSHAPETIYLCSGPNWTGECHLVKWPPIQHGMCYVPKKEDFKNSYWPSNWYADQRSVSCVRAIKNG